MKATVIIPTLNAGASLPALLDMLRLQGMKHEVLVADSQSDDGTLEEAARAHVRVLTIPRREFSHGGTRNLAALASRGEYLVFLTQDALPVDDSLLENLVAPMDRDPGIAVTYGRQLAREDAPAIEKLFRAFLYPARSSTRDWRDIPRLGVKTFFCSNACAAYRREAFLELGMFDGLSIMNEDMELVSRAVMSGRRVHYAADARVWHSHRYTPAQQFRRYVDIGVFFADNKHLAALSQNEAEGRRYLASAARLLVRQRDAHSLAHLFLDCAARYAGYRVGAGSRFLPRGIMRRLSMNRNHWS